uniref:Ig-like domain-containing protein n=1 Tax=Pygocentrus nattereri TaxID=42514 RepID=A0A3B4D5P2_PYGNA
MVCFLETLTYFIFTECRGKDTVLQPRRQQWASERETVTLDCEYNTTRTGPTLLWYQQKDQHSPKYILLKHTFGAGDTAAEFRERFHSNLNSSTRRAPLMIQKLSVRDSAVYYCALQPTSLRCFTKTHTPSVCFEHKEIKVTSKPQYIICFYSLSETTKVKFLR